jgi:hypothetical protein
MLGVVTAVLYRNGFALSPLLLLPTTVSDEHNKQERPFPSYIITNDPKYLSFGPFYSIYIIPSVTTERRSAYIDHQTILAPKTFEKVKEKYILPTHRYYTGSLMQLCLVSTMGRNIKNTLNYEACYLLGRAR